MEQKSRAETAAQKDVENFDVIIVGAGIAGLTSAAYAAKNGYKTLLCEKREKPGGLVGGFTRNGFTFDAGIRAFENSGIVFPMLKQLGITMEFVKNPVVIALEDQKMRFQGEENLDDYKKMLFQKFPENQRDIEAIIKEIKRVMGYMEVLYGIENPLFMDLSTNRSYLFKKLLPWLLRYQIKIGKAQKLGEPIAVYLKRFTKNQALIDVIIQHFFENMPTFFALSYFGLYNDYIYPVGGTGVLVDRIADFFTARGGEIALNTEIVQIDIKKKMVKTRTEETYLYRELIWCGDMKTLYHCVEWDGENKAVADQKEKIASNRGGDSILTLYLAVNLNRSYFKKRCGAHCFYTPSAAGISSMRSKGWKEVLLDQEADKSQNKKLLKEWIREYLNLTTYEISCPVLRDLSLAPSGKSGLMISTLMDYRLVKAIQKQGWYREFKQLCEESILALLEKDFFPGLRANIEDRFSSTPLTIERLTGNSGGAITGWAFRDDGKNLPAVNVFREISKSTLTPIPHIHQAGQWTFSPSGMPVSILTGKLAADDVIKSLNRSPDAPKAKREVL